ncbi:uncharacterized protein [Spinacia oleracea]|nr:uncharacterized protein LOC110795420 isoform X2 [Spinacia oleracea]
MMRITGENIEGPIAIVLQFAQVKLWRGKRTADKWECRTPKRTRISRWDEGDLALREAHPLCHHQDILITQIFTKLDWEGQAAVQMVCKQWRRWAKLRYRLPYHYPQGFFLKCFIVVLFAMEC